VEAWAYAAHDIRNEVVYPGWVVGKSSRNWHKRQKLCLLDKGNTIFLPFPEKEDTEKV